MYKLKLLFALFMLILTSMIAWGQTTKQYGNWTSDKSIAGLQIANTTNSTGSTAGVICNLKTESCDAYVAIDLGCEDDAFYPMMINSAVGAYPLRMKCMHLGKLKLYVAEEFSSMIEAFESGGEIGFAMPLQSGQFRVIRFSTSGATAAIKEARQLPPPERGKANRKRSDETL